MSFVVRNVGIKTRLIHVYYFTFYCLDYDKNKNKNNNKNKASDTHYKEWVEAPPAYTPSLIHTK